jgi:hypothetical protein
MSAKHVLGVVPPDGQLLAIFLHDESQATRIVPLTEIYLDPDYDVAVARGKAPHWEHLKIAGTDNVVMNSDVLTVEYSATQQHLPRSDGEHEMKVVASYHKGHVVRRTEEVLGHSRPAQCIDLSFPALQGASGAPIIYNDQTAAVIGLVVANVARHLLPAQILRTNLGGEEYEEVRYLLPYGQAIQAQHLRDALIASGLLRLPAQGAISRRWQKSSARTSSPP